MVPRDVVRHMRSTVSPVPQARRGGAPGGWPGRVSHRGGPRARSGLVSPPPGQPVRHGDRRQHRLRRQARRHQLHRLPRQQQGPAAHLGEPSPANCASGLWGGRRRPSAGSPAPWGSLGLPGACRPAGLLLPPPPAAPCPSRRLSFSGELLSNHSSVNGVILTEKVLCPSLLCGQSHTHSLQQRAPPPPLLLPRGPFPPQIPFFLRYLRTSYRYDAR